MIVDQPTPYFSILLNDDPEKQPECVNDWAPFWQLIERPNNAALAAELANQYCGTCPVRDTCLRTKPTEDENWAPAAHTILGQVALIARKNAANAA